MICKLFGHLWTNPSNVMCFHRCERCRLEEYWCRRFKTIAGGANQGWEQNVCQDCHGEEVINGGSLVSRERDTKGVWA